MEIDFLPISLLDFSKEITLRSDVKFHSIFSAITETNKIIPFKKFFEVVEITEDFSDLNDIKYVEIGSVSNDGDIYAFDLSDERLDPIEKERILKKIENNDIFKPEINCLLIPSVRPNLKKFIAISQKEEDLYFTKAFICLKPKSDLICSELSKYLLRTVLYERLVALCREGKGYPTLKRDDLKFLFLENDLVDIIEKFKAKLKLKISENEYKIFQIKQKIEPLQGIIDDVFRKNGNPTIPKYKRNDEYILRNRFSNIYKTNWLSIRAYLCRFVEDELPVFLKENLKNQYLPFSRYVNKIRSGEYIPKKYYSIDETNFVYLRVNNISSNELDLEDSIFLQNSIGQKYVNIKINENDLIMTRSGTVGKCIIYNKDPNDDKVYIPSHHIAVIHLNTIEDALFLKYYLQSSFCSDFLWAFSTGKSQKEITNWSIRKLPIPAIDRNIRDEIVKEIQQREEKNNQYKAEIKRLRTEIDNLIIKTLTQK